MGTWPRRESRSEIDVHSDASPPPPPDKMYTANGTGWPWPVSPVLPISTSYLSRCKLIFQLGGLHYGRPEWLALAERMPGYKDIDDFWTYMMRMDDYVTLCYP